jgi:hypothetical protein
MASPLSKNYNSQAIGKAVPSSVTLAPTTLAEGEAMGVKFESMGTKSLAELQAIPAE